MIDQTRVMAVRATLPCPDSLTLGIALTRQRVVHV